MVTLLEAIINVKGGNKANKEFNSISKNTKQLGDAAAEAANRFNRLGNKMGFAAFQMTFLASVAGNALRQIQQNIGSMVEEGSKDLSTIGRAITRSGFDISAAAGESREAVNLLNNAIRTFAAGDTIFNIQEVAGAFDAVGRAVNFTGTELERAQKQILVTKEVLNLMTIEELNAEEAAKNFVKTMKIFKGEITSVSQVTDVLVAVNNSSTITLDGLGRSLGFAGQQAREFGLTFEETAATLGVVQDRLGVLNGGPGRNLSILLQNLSELDAGFNKELIANGVVIRDLTTGKLNPLVQTLGQFRDALLNAGPPGSALRKRMFDLINATSRGERTLLSLIQGYDELVESIENAENSTGIAERMANAFEQLPEERINRAKNAFKSLRTELVGALSPAIEVLADELRTLATAPEVQEFFQAIGTAITEFITPAIKTATVLFRNFAKALKDNEYILKLVTGGFVTLIGVLSALFIIGTVGALTFALGSIMEKTATNSLFLSVATNTLFKSFLKWAVAGFGIFLILKGIDAFLGVVKDGIDASEAPTLALAAAMTGLGTAMFGLSTGLLDIKAIREALSIGIGSGGITEAIKAIPTTLKSSLENVKLNAGAIGKSIGDIFRGNFSTAAARISPDLGRRIQGLGTGSILGIALIAGSALGVAIGFAIREAVKDAKDFGFSSAGELIISDWAITLARLNVGWQQWRADFLQGLADATNATREFFRSIREADWETLGRELNDKLIGPLLQSIKDIRQTFGKLSDAVFSDPEAFLRTEAVDNLEKLLKAQLKQDFGLQALATSGSFVGIEQQVLSLIRNSEGFKRWNKNFGEFVSDDEVLALIGDFQIRPESLNKEMDKTALQFIEAAQAVQNGTSTMAQYELVMSQVGEKINEFGKEIEEGTISQAALNAEMEANMKKYEDAGIIDQKAIEKTLNEAPELPVVPGQPNDGLGDGVSITTPQAGDLIQDTGLADSEAVLAEAIEAKTIEMGEDLVVASELTEAQRARLEAEYAAIQSALNQGIVTEQILERQQAIGEVLAQQNENLIMEDEQVQKHIIEQTKLNKDTGLLDKEIVKDNNLLLKINELQSGGLIPNMQIQINAIAINHTLLETINSTWKNTFIPLTFALISRMYIMRTRMDEVNTQLGAVRDALKALVARINRTSVKITKDENGKIVDAKLVGPGAPDISNLRPFADGGIVTRGPIAGLVGEAGPEAVIPLNQIDSLTRGGGGDTITINNTFTIEGNVDEDNIEELAERVSEITTNQIRNKQSIR